MDPRVATLVETLRLAPHPEGGYFREIHRSALAVAPEDGRGARSALTVIYFLLAGGQHSRWHRVRSDEVWQPCDGEPLELLVADERFERVERIRFDHRHGPAVHVVPAGCWQAARPLGGYALVTCTVGPGFDFADFEFLAASQELMARLTASSPELARLA